METSSRQVKGRLGHTTSAAEEEKGLSRARHFSVQCTVRWCSAMLCTQGRSQHAQCHTGHGCFGGCSGDSSTADHGVLDSVELNSIWYHECNRRSGYCEHFYVQISMLR